jgi:hypothetical protein
MSLSALADQAVLRATPLGPGAPSLAPPIRKGTTLYFVAAPNQELAEFLRARRASDIPGWQAYLQRYPSSPHLADAKRALATLFIEAGAVALHNYQKSLGTDTPTYSDLKTAKSKSDQAHALLPNLEIGVQLDKGVHKALTAIVEEGKAELAAYRAAVTARSAGYLHLPNAKKFSDVVTDIDMNLLAGQALQGDVLQEENTFEAAIQSAVFAQNAKQYDQAYSFVAPYRFFAEEEPRISAVVESTYSYHLARGNQFDQDSNWKSAIEEFDKAGSTKDTAEARDSLKNAKQQLVISQDKEAAAKALDTSKAYQAQHNVIRAYEVLANLPQNQQALVTAEMKELEPGYIQSASNEAKGLRQAHDPIKGMADEIGIENAYRLLQSAYNLSQNESYRDRMDLLGNELSAYLLDQAKHYLAKPGGSGTELGWTYLTEALQYKAENLDAVRDAMVTASPAHSMRSKLSIRVQFRDQTSQRDSTGFAGQLENAIITGLESSTVPVKVVRAGETTAVDPDFELAGDVMQHHLSVVPTIEPQESKYLAGEKEVPSEEWNKANRAYEKATMELSTAQTTLQGAEARGIKKTVEDLTKSVAEAQKAVELAHDRLDATPKTVTTDVIRSYTYTKRTINLSGAIQLQFRVGDSLTGQMSEPVIAAKEDHKQFVLLENVKPEDTEGIKVTGTPPDTAEFLTALESATLDALVKAVRERVEELPKKIFQNASSRESESDLDGAGEFYLRYLKITPDTPNDEHQRAKRFLQEQFNMEPIIQKAQ